MVGKIGNGMILLGVNQKDLEESVIGLEQLKPILQMKAAIGNGDNHKQAAIDASELGKHFDTAINSMKILLSGFDDYRV